MARIKSFKVQAVDLPFKNAFKHAAAARTFSSSLVTQLTTDAGVVGFGESLPREYVTGESQESTFQLLVEKLAPRLSRLDFSSLDDVISFLDECNGECPAEWEIETTPHTAAWCAIELALLDAFSRHFEQPIRLDCLDPSVTPPNYSAVISSEASLKTLLKIRLAGIRQVKLKVESSENEQAVRRCRRFLGARCDIRADANMAWNLEQAVREMKSLASFGIESFEQPLPAEQIDEAAELIRRLPNLGIMADESLNNHSSLVTLLERKACTSVNVRISKCGGLIAAYNRCKLALANGLDIQIGCQVGETSLLSSAHLMLRNAVPQVRYLEGCFGAHLLHDDPGDPRLQFGFRGKPPGIPGDAGLGIQMDDTKLADATRLSQTIEY